MTVDELIQRLKAEESDKEVLIIDSEYGALGIMSIRNDKSGNVMLETD